MGSSEDLPERPSVEVLQWRIRTLETIEAALRTEIYELRKELPEYFKSFREDYYTKHESRVVFMTRADLQALGEQRRQWPLILASVTVALAAVLNLALLAAGLR